MSLIRTFDLPIPSSAGENAALEKKVKPTLIVNKVAEDVTVTLCAYAFDSSGGNYVRGAGGFLVPGSAQPFPYAVVALDQASASGGGSGVKSAYILTPDVPQVIPLSRGEELYAAARFADIFGATQRVYLSVAVARERGDLRALVEAMTSSFARALSEALPEAIKTALGRK